MFSFIHYLLPCPGKDLKGFILPSTISPNYIYSTVTGTGTIPGYQNLGMFYTHAYTYRQNHIRQRGAGNVAGRNRTITLGSGHVHACIQRPVYISKLVQRIFIVFIHCESKGVIPPRSGAHMLSKFYTYIHIQHTYQVRIQ